MGSLSFAITRSWTPTPARVQNGIAAGHGLVRPHECRRPQRIALTLRVMYVFPMTTTWSALPCSRGVDPRARGRFRSPACWGRDQLRPALPQVRQRRAGATLAAGRGTRPRDGDPRMDIRDRYLIGTRLRLREVTDADGTVVRKLGHKVRLGDGPGEVACTSVYLDDTEWDLLAALPADILEKRRTVIPVEGGAVAVDVFGGHLVGLVLAEIDSQGRAVHRPAGLLPLDGRGDRRRGLHRGGPGAFVIGPTALPRPSTSCILTSREFASTV